MLPSRQDRIRSELETLPMGESLTRELFPKELKRFKTEYPALTFDVLSTKTGENRKIHLVKISL